MQYFEWNAWLHIFRADSRLSPSQWEMSLQSNAISHWLSANLESTLIFVMIGSDSGLVIIWCSPETRESLKLKLDVIKIFISLVWHLYGISVKSMLKQNLIMPFSWSVIISIISMLMYLMGQKKDVIWCIGGMCSCGLIMLLSIYRWAPSIHVLMTWYFYLSTLNSFPPSTEFIRQWMRLASVQIMACRLFDAKPLSKPMLGQLDPKEQTSVKF